MRESNKIKNVKLIYDVQLENFKTGRIQERVTRKEYCAVNSKL